MNQPQNEKKNPIFIQSNEVYLFIYSIVKPKLENSESVKRIFLETKIEILLKMF